MIKRAAAEPAQHAAGRPKPIATYLFVLALVALVPAFVFSAILLERNNEAQQRVVETLVTGTAGSIVEAVDREVAANIATLRVLATDPALSAGDFHAYYVRSKQALEGSGSYMYLLGADMMTILSTRVEFDAPPRPSADPELGRRAIATGQILVSNVVLGAVSNRWVFNIVMPLTFRGQEPMVLGLNRNADDLAAALLSDKMPIGWNVALVDGNGMVVAASPGTAMPGSMFELAAPETPASSRGWTDIVSGDQHYLAVVQRSPLTGWALFTWAPRDLIARPLSTAFWSLLVGGILLAAVVILVIYWVSLQIGRSVHGLEDDARRLGLGQPVRAHDYPISEIANVSQALADASQRRKAAENEVRLLMRELAHRSKNQLTVIAAMAKQSAKAADSVPEFVSSFERRIYSLGRSTDLLLAHGVGGIDLRDVLARQIDPFCPLDSGRLELSGPSLKINTHAAQTLGMAAHELATNAARHGAFATEDGNVDVVWSVALDNLELTWRESRASSIDRPYRRGFGTTVLETIVGRTLGATVTRSLDKSGIEWRFVIPMASLDPHHGANPETKAAPADEALPEGTPSAVEK